MSNKVEQLETTMDKVTIILSDKLKELLENFKDKSIIAELLLKGEFDRSSLIDGHANYISISDSDKTKISYLTEDRIKNIDDDKYWTTSRRYHCKPGSFVLKIFKGIPSYEIERFSSLYISYVSNISLPTKIVKGSDITKYYFHEAYSEQSSSLGNSCMKYPKCYKYFDIYEKNPDIVSMLIMFSSEGSDKIVGRAILWDIKNEDGTISKVMDRIYTTNDERLQFLFKKWADENGYIYKSQQSWTSTISFTRNKEIFEFQTGIKLSGFNFNHYPYMDTFKFLDRKEGVLFNYKPSEFNYDEKILINGEYMNRYVTLASPDGSYYLSDYFVFDNIARNWNYRGTMICYDGVNYTIQDNCYYSETLSSHILRSESDYNEELQDYIYNDLTRVDEKLLENRRTHLKMIEEQREKMRQKMMIDREKMASGSVFAAHNLYTSIWERPERIR